jgi:hypothetical protein
MHWVKSANSRKLVEQYFLGEFWDIAQWLSSVGRFSQIWLWVKYRIRKSSISFSNFWLPTWKPCMKIWRFFFGFGWILGIENLKKDLILALSKFMT